MAKNTVAIKVGRLLEVRADAGYRCLGDVDVVFDAIDAAVASLPRAQTIVTIVDWRRCPVMESIAAQRLVARIVPLNIRVERSSALASRDASVAVMQFMRLIRESGSPLRKMFFDTELLIGWLAEVLTTAEIERARQFLKE